MRDTLLYLIAAAVILLTTTLGFRLAFKSQVVAFKLSKASFTLSGMLFIACFMLIANQDGLISSYVPLLLMGVCLLGGLGYYKASRPQRRKIIDRFVKFILICAASLATLVTFTIIFSLILESLQFFQTISFIDFITGLRWSPNTASDMGHFGIIPLFIGTVLITVIAMVIAVPAGLMSAIFLSCYAHQKLRTTLKPLLELLAGIPTVVFGFLALIAISPILQFLGQAIGLSIAAESALGVGVVMGFMIIPYIASLSDDVIRAVPKTLNDGSMALGATKSETIKRVIVPAAFPGIMASFLLAISRAIGETMIVVMAAGYSARLTINPLESVTTMTVQIVSLLTGDQEFSSPKTLAAFALGLILLGITLMLNIFAMKVIRHYREKYDG